MLTLKSIQQSFFSYFLLRIFGILFSLKLLRIRYFTHCLFPTSQFHIFLVEFLVFQLFSKPKLFFDKNLRVILELHSCKKIQAQILDLTVRCLFSMYILDNISFENQYLIYIHREKMIRATICEIIIIQFQFFYQCNPGMKRQEFISTKCFTSRE